MTFLLNHTANGTTENIDQRIQEWIQKQVPKLKGSPLAAVEIGEDLKKKTTSQEKCDIFDDIERHLGSVYRAHLFTYHHLPPHLQRCFQFCSIFPNNCKFEHDKLTKMWMALGFVEEKAHALVGNGVRNMEHVARGYFDDLVDRSLFQLEQSKGGGDKHAHYMIYEQIHWMLRLASDKNCISIPRRSTAPKSIPETVRHLSVASNCLDLLKVYPSWELNKMRTLLVLENDDGSMSSTFNKGILKLFKGVRVLDLTAKIGLTHLLRTIHNLKHVRYLDIDMACIANISGIGRMAKLQGPIEFKAIRASEKEGHAVLELEGMDSVRGMLSIKGLDAVAGKEEAIKARLEQKSAVKVLKLEWGPTDLRRVNSGPADFDAVAVLEGLQPHRDLHELRITRYPGAASPSWLGVKMEKLVYLYLRNCRRLTAMPVLGELPCLELLDVKELPCVKRIEGGFRGAGTFPKLKKVVLDDMPRLLAWGDMPKLAFPRLTEVSIVDCPRLSSLSGLERCAGSLTLRLKGCPHIIEVTLKAITGVSTYKFH